MTPGGPVRFFAEADDDEGEGDVHHPWSLGGATNGAAERLLRMKKSLSTPSLSSLYSPPLGQLVAKKPMLAATREDDDDSEDEQVLE